MADLCRTGKPKDPLWYHFSRRGLTFTNGLGSQALEPALPAWQGWQAGLLALGCLEGICCSSSSSNGILLRGATGCWNWRRSGSRRQSRLLICLWLGCILCLQVPSLHRLRNGLLVQDPRLNSWP